MIRQRINLRHHLPPLTEEEIKEKHPKLWEAWISRPEITRIPEGEALSDVQKRTTRAINEALKNTTGNIAFTYHKITNLLYLLYITGTSIKQIWEYLDKNPISLGQITKVEMPEGKIIERIETESE